MVLDSAAWSIDSSAVAACVFRRSPSAPWALAALDGLHRWARSTWRVRGSRLAATPASTCSTRQIAYSRGLSEEILGEALGSDRDEVLIATKVRNADG